MIEAILCNGDNEAAISSADPGGGPVDGNKVEPGLLPRIGRINRYILSLITITVKLQLFKLFYFLLSEFLFNSYQVEDLVDESVNIDCC